MSKKATKNYNKMIMQSGYRAQQRLDELLDLVQDYTTNYADRLDFWTGKLNNVQLDLIQDKYLAQNASMLRNMGAFGSNSQLNQQINENAYDQQNYLANVQNQNIAIANQLQSNELSALGNAASLNTGERNMGATAASNVDAANNYWLAVLGSSVENAGKIVSAAGGTWGKAIGAGMQAAGSAAQSVAGIVQDINDSNSVQAGDRTSANAVGFWNAVGQLRQQYGDSSGSSSSSLSIFDNPYTSGSGSAIYDAAKSYTEYGDWGDINTDGIFS